MGPKIKETTVQRSQRSLKMTCSLTLAACFCVSAAAVGGKEDRTATDKSGTCSTSAVLVRRCTVSA